MRAQDFRTMDKQELASRIEVLEGEYYLLREKVHAGKEKNNQQLRARRADIARARTVLQES